MKRSDKTSIGILGLALLFVAGCGGSSAGLTKDRYTADNHDRFSIESGSPHSTLDCNDCHGAFDTFSEFTCIDCHTHEEATTTTAHAGIDGFVYDNHACYSCHPQGTSALDGIDHETFFPIAAGTNHANTPCVQCHTDTTNRHVLGCATEACHPEAEVAPQHSGVSGFTYDSPSCYSCHPRGTAEPVDHAAIFLIGAGTQHETATCSDCHTDVTSWPVVTCIGSDCHPQTTMSGDHTAVRGYAWTTADCLDCHPTPSVFRVQNHNNCVTHKEATCRRCHSIDLPSKPFPATDFNRYTCTGLNCHGGNEGTNCNDD